MVAQYAYGTAYKYFFPKKKLNDIHFGCYQAIAQSQSLAPVLFTSQGNEYTDFRDIAGATTQGSHAGFSIMPSSRSAMHIDVNYDRLHYNTLYQLPSNVTDKQGFGASLAI